MASLSRADVGCTKITCYMRPFALAVIKVQSFDNISSTYRTYRPYQLAALTTQADTYSG
jgi:hypothetical protein